MNKYTENNKEKIREYQKKYRETNKEKILDYAQEYRKNNKEKIKEYRKTPSGKKTLTKASWKRWGLNMENFEEIYNIYITTTTCNKCKILLTTGSKTTCTTKCMDHCHYSGEFRRILCNSCNCKEPKQPICISYE